MSGVDIAPAAGQVSSGGQDALSAQPTRKPETLGYASKTAPPLVSQISPASAINTNKPAQAGNGALAHSTISHPRAAGIIPGAATGEPTPLAASKPEFTAASTGDSLRGDVTDTGRFGSNHTITGTTKNTAGSVKDAATAALNASFGSTTQGAPATDTFRSKYSSANAITNKPAVPAGGAVGVGRGTHPSALLTHQHPDRMVMFLTTLVTYPFMFLMTQAAAAASAVNIAGVGGGGIDTRKRLEDFPEGAAIADLESWCREPVYGIWWKELVVRGLIFVRQLLLTALPYDTVRQVLNFPFLLKLLGINRYPPLTQLVDSYMPRAKQLLADGSPQDALAELQSLVIPNIEAIKSRLEERYRLSRGPTPLERLDFLTKISRTASFVFFSWLRGLARLCTYLSGVLSVISGALSFTVVPSIILSVLSAMCGICQLILTGTADLLEPTINGLLALTETGKDKAASLSIAAGASPIGPRHLPPATVEQLEGFLEQQLTQVSGLINRPEIPRLAGLNKALLVKAYDLGLIDALGKTEQRAVRELLEAARAQGVLHILLRGGTNAAVAAVNLDVSRLVTVASELATSLANALTPKYLGGDKASVKRLFRSEGFFSYADERQAQVALVLLCRLLSWLHLASVLAPGSQDCLRFVLILGQSQAGKSELFTKLVAAPPEYAAQLGGTEEASTKSARKGDKLAHSSAAGTAGAGAGAGAVFGGASREAAVDLRPVAGELNTYACVFPGLNSTDAGISHLSKAISTALGGLASAVVYLVHPNSEPSAEKLALLEGPLAAGRHVLVAVNGPGRVKGLLNAAASGQEPAGANTAEGAIIPGPSTPLESLRSRWQAAAEAFCATRGLAPSLLGVVVSELQDDTTDLPPGVHKFKQVRSD
eukprot:GHRR01004960.1.p1 GENE.GHRR01004960.1~~GHRR01004960.1.p1  ORF type:complete len:884 (+),score=323.86 GHRR01004960.1:843-3494(+)